MSLADQIKKFLQDRGGDIQNPTEISDEVFQVTRNGRLLEQSFFGFTIADYGTFNFDPSNFISFDEAFDEMSKSQPVGYDPLNPSGGRNKEFIDAVRSFIKSQINEEIKLYISIGSKLDIWHGADAVFEFRGVKVTIDLTADTDKISKQEAGEMRRNRAFVDEQSVTNADILVRESDIESGEVFTTISRDIALLLLKRYNLKYRLSYSGPSST